MTKFYDLKDLEAHVPDADYHVIFGERSNGKTFAVLSRILERWVDKSEQSAYIRRYDEDIRGDNGKQIFAALTHRDLNDEKKTIDMVSKLTNGEWTDVVYKSRAWHLARYDEKLGRMISQQTPFCYAFALSTWERKKGVSFPGVMTILFDEFLSRDSYLRDEFVIFQNVISSLARQRGDLKIYMLGNTVNVHAPYFKEMGIEAEKMEQGDIEVIVLEDKKTKATIAVQYCMPAEGGKESDKYQLFGNRSLKMITEGKWEIPMYPHRPVDYVPHDIVSVFYIDFEDKDRVVQGDVVSYDDNLFIYLHEEFVNFEEEDIDDYTMIYRLRQSPKINHAVSLSGPAYRNKISAMIGRLIKEGQVYYQDNSIGELVRYYQEEAAHSIVGIS